MTTRANSFQNGKRSKLQLACRECRGTGQRKITLYKRSTNTMRQVLVMCSCVEQGKARRARQEKAG